MNVLYDDHCGCRRDRAKCGEISGFLRIGTHSQCNSFFTDGFDNLRKIYQSLVRGIMSTKEYLFVG
jgi:hypothetical protein